VPARCPIQQTHTAVFGAALPLVPTPAAQSNCRTNPKKKGGGRGAGGGWTSIHLYAYAPNTLAGPQPQGKLRLPWAVAHHVCCVCARAAHPRGAGGAGLRKAALRTGSVFGVPCTAVSARAHSVGGLTEVGRSFIFAKSAPVAMGERRRMLCKLEQNNDITGGLGGGAEASSGIETQCTNGQRPG
jgi:hypothetical protein